MSKAKRYKVEMQETAYYTVIVEANDRQEAEEVATGMMNEGKLDAKNWDNHVENVQEM